MLKKSLALLIAAFISIPLVVAVAQAPGYNKLEDIWVFKDKLLGTWSGGDLVAPNGTIPVDTNQVYNGLPSLSFNVQGPSQWWWLSMLAGDSWRAYSIEFYPPHGFLEFDVLGAAGGEQFNISLADTNPARSGGDLGTSSVNVGNYVTVSTSWQHVRIPLTDFVAPEGFNFRQLHLVQISESYSGPYAKQFWLNGIKFTSPDTEHTFPAIKVNQVGYKPLGPKYALVTGFAEQLPATAGAAFHVIRASDGKSVYNGTLTLVTAYDQGVSGEEILRADFSRVFIPGTYFIRVDAAGVDDSLQFKIGYDVYKELLRDSMRYYYPQRQGIEIDVAKGLYQAEPGLEIEAERMAFHHAAVAKMQPDSFGFGDQIADGQHQPVVDQHAIAGALGTQRFRAEGVVGDDRMQPNHRGKHAIEIETVVARARLIRRRHFPFSQRGHGESPGLPVRRCSADCCHSGRAKPATILCRKRPSRKSSVM